MTMCHTFLFGMGFEIVGSNNIIKNYKECTTKNYLKNL